MLWLYDEFETDFTYNGIVLNNAYDSDIHWVLNTMYKLTFKYPTVDNDLYSFIEKGMIVKADEHDRTNLFRIKDIDISENDKCITVTAYQKNYDFSKRLVNNFSRVRVNCMSVLDEWYSQFLSNEKDFSYYSDISDINSFSTYKDEKDNQPKSSFDLLGEIASVYSADIDMHDKQISLLRKLGRDTEEVLTTAKNISEFVNTSNSDEIVTRIYATATFRVGDKDDKKDLQARHREELRALRQSQKEYSQRKNTEKKSQQIQEEIAKKYAKELAKQNKSVKRSGTTSKSYSQIESEVRAKYQVREQKAQVRRVESQALADRKKSEIESLKARQKDEAASLDEEVTISLIIESPLINDYPFINEISISNNDLRTAEELEEWAMEYFTKGNIDKPKNSIKVTYEQLSENINRGDTVILKYLKYGVDERIRVVETHYDPMLKKWKEFILGEKEGRLGSEVSHVSSGAEVRANAYTDRLSMDIDRRVEERSKNYDELFKKNTDEINKKIEDGFEKAKASSEVTIAKIDEDLEKKLAPIRNQVSTTVENYNRQFQATNLEISKNRVEATKQIQEVNLEISKNRIEATKQIQVLSDRVNNMQDISNNSTVVELKRLVNEAKETGKNINQKVTELEGNVTREFSSVKAKNENDLKVIRGEIKTGVDGLTSKISSLEEYKNQDGSRTESLKQWMQRDTASQLSRERTEITRIVDAKGYVKNTEFSNKFNDNAQGINRKLEVLETYKNQDGIRTANLQIWTQNNTANQLTAERRSIESWVNEKGYATNSVVENKVQETANSISREIRNVRESIPTNVGGRNYIVDSDKLTNINSGGTNWEKTVENGTLVFTKVRATESTGIWTQIMPFLKDNFQNEVLTWSLEVKASKNISFNNVGQETNGFKGRVDLTTNWQRISHTFTNRYTQHYAFVFYQMLGTCSPGDKVYVRLPKLEIGNVATDWTPAPEDNNVFVKNTEFSSKFNENAQGINRQLSALETYKNQDAVRVANMQIWAQNNTANQLTAARRSIESWVNEKGYATTSVVENKVQETADSFSREISNVRNSILTSIGGRNYITDSKNLNNKGFYSWNKWDKSVERDTLILTKIGGSDTYGFYFNLTDLVKTQFQNETLTWSIDVKASRNVTLRNVGFETNGLKQVDITTEWQRISHTFINKFTNVFAFVFYNPTANFNNGDKIYIKLPKLEKGNIATDWTPAPEDDQQSINELNTWKQTATQTLNTVSSGLNDAVKHSQLRIGADGIDFGSNKVFNGRNLASILSVSPESIKAITDRLIITPSNENLVLPEFRESVISNRRDTWITPLITDDKLQNGDQFIIEGIGSWTGRLTQSLKISIQMKYKGGNYSWITPLVVRSDEYSTTDTLKCTLTITGLTGEIENYKIGILQDGPSNFTTITFKNAKIYKKKSAELIVDGSIEGRQIKTNTLETGHHKAESITSEIIAANAVKAKHVLIDDGLINNLITHNAFINKLWAQQAFINKLNAVKIKSTQIDSDTLNGVVISGQSKIKIGQYGFLQPIAKGLQINAPENFGSKRGIGLQIAGEGVGPKENGVPPGLFIYEDPDFTRGTTIPSAVNRVLLTVAGMACFSSRILGSVVKGQPILTNLDYSSPFSNHAPVKFIGYKEGGLMRFFSTDNSNSDIWNIKVDQWGSDRKLKTDIKDSEFNAIEFVDKLKFKEHGWNKDEVGYERPYTKCGLIAQELQALDESLVVDYETYLGLDALRLINIALKAIQELSQQNKELKQKLEEITNG